MAPSWTTDALAGRRLIEVTGGAMGVRETGSGPPVVFILGLVANGLAWRTVVPRLGHRPTETGWPGRSELDRIRGTGDEGPRGPL